MKKFLFWAALAFSTAFVPVGASAAERGTAEEASALVKKGIAYLKANGPEKSYAAFNDPQGQFVDRDLYLVIYGLDGVVRTHGANPKMIGKNLMEIRDVDGKFFIKERIELAKKKKPFWQDYKFTNPTNGKIEPKTMYCVPEDDMVLCGGVYLK